MKLVAFTIGTVVVENDNGETFIYRKNDSSKLSEYSISRLRDVGFHVLEKEVASVDEAKLFANEKLKELGAYCE
jgi:ligand-binding sensor protein